MVNIACAPNLDGIIQKVFEAFDKDNKIELTIGDNCMVYQKAIIEQKPYDIFLGADVNGPKELVNLGLASELRVYAKGRLCIFSFYKKPQTKDIELAELIVIPDPKVAPYGRASVEFLKNINLYDESKLVFGKNPKDVIEVYKNSKASLVFLPLSFVLANLKSDNYLELDSSFYTPVEQAGVIVNETEESKSLFDFITLSEKAQSIFRGYGL